MSKKIFIVDEIGRLEANFYNLRITDKNALKLSILKWEFIVWYIEGGFDPSLVNCGGWPTCALCLKFRLCSKCPVGRAGFLKCNNTPHELFEQSPTLKNAKAELEFLKSLT